MSSLGISRITVQFDLSRSIEGAARDVQAAINAALSDLPGDLPTLPTFRKANPAAAPILILALTSKTMLPSAIYDAADTVIAQRMSQVDGVADVDGRRLRAAGHPRQRRSDAARRHGRQHWRTCAAPSPTPTRVGPLGAFDGNGRASPSAPTTSCARPSDYDPRRGQDRERHGDPARPTSPTSRPACATAWPPAGTTATRRCC